MLNASNLVIGAKLMTVEMDEQEIVALNGRWVKLDDGTNISRADALAGMQIWIDENPTDEEQAFEDLELDAEETNELDAEELADEEDGNKMAETIRKYREAYTKVVSYNGNNSLDNGDEVAEVLRGMSPDETCALADKVFEQPAMHHAERWQHLNAGSRRMNAGNRIRGAVKRGEVTPDQLRAWADGQDIKDDEADV